jgi:hypothetical protein
MKNIIKIAVFAFIVLAASCNDDFMERYPLDKINDGSFWTSPNDLRLYVNNLYSRGDLLPRDDGWGSIGIYGWDADRGSDIQVYYQYNTRMNSEGTVPATGGGWNTGDWATLRNINHFMDHYKAVEAAVGFDAVKQFVGEALFFRSIFYFDKLRRFGDLPWASTTVGIDSDVLFSPRLPRNQVVDSIMLDLDRAVEYLSARGTGAWTGRVTRETAMALQARVALYEGTWEKYHAGTPFAAAVNQSEKFLQKAADVAGALITMSETVGSPALSGVGAVNGYRDLFNQQDYSNNREVIFWKRYQVGVNTNNWSRYSGNGAGRGATKSMVDSYLKIDGTPVALGYDDATLVKVAEGRDPRLSQSIQINDGNHFRWQAATPTRYFIAPAFDGWDSEESTPTGYQIYKGHNFRLADAWPGGQGIEAMIYFRFGETLLIYAEAKAELGTITQADLDRSVNKLRARVGMPPMSIGVANDPNFEFASLPAIIQEIRRERKVELAFEGFRVDDIMRWAAADELIAGKIPVGAKLAQWEDFNFSDYLPQSLPDLERQDIFEERIALLEADADGYIKIFKNTLNGGTQGFRFNVNRDYLFPLPSNELVLNPNLKQNPGW